MSKNKESDDTSADIITLQPACTKKLASRHEESHTRDSPVRIPSKPCSDKGAEDCGARPHDGDGEDFALVMTHPHKQVRGHTLTHTNSPTHTHTQSDVEPPSLHECRDSYNSSIAVGRADWE